MPLPFIDFWPFGVVTVRADELTLSNEAALLERNDRNLREHRYVVGKNSPKRNDTRSLSGIDDDVCVASIGYFCVAFVPSSLNVSDK